MKIVFMGTPEFALPCLRRLAESEHEVVAVLSQPDRERDKKGKLLPTPVKALAQALGIGCYQFESVSKQGVELLRGLKPDLAVTAAFGQLLSVEVLQIPCLGVWNVHASLLPKFRGSSPVQAALSSGATETGVTVMQTAKEMDTGDILGVKKVAVLPEDTAESLQIRLAEVGADALAETLDKSSRGELSPVRQDEAAATYTKKITKEDGLIDWRESAEKIVNKIRAFNPWPVAFTYADDKNLKIYAAEQENGTGVPGSVLRADSVPGGLIVACGEGAVRILRLQAPGKRILCAADFLRGFSLKRGDSFSDGRKA